MSRTLNFSKGHGTGNDFILYADPEGTADIDAATVARLCDRHVGVGADGLMRAVRTRALPEVAGLLQDAPEAEWFMDYRNADGSIAEMCGNGIRVFAAFLRAEGLIDTSAGSSWAIATRAGVRDVFADGGGYRVDLGRWRLDSEEALVHIGAVAVPRPGLALNLGNPHVVVALADDAELDGADLLRAPRVDPQPNSGVNVELVVPHDPLVQDGVGRIRMRVHERGVGETLSCGTGTAAAALAVRHWAGPAAPHMWRVEVPGGVLGVRMFPAEDGEHVALSGPATIVFRGTIQLDDERGRGSS